MKVKCKNCGKEFNIKPSALARGWGKYCSVACRSESVKNTITLKEDYAELLIKSPKHGDFIFLIDLEDVDLVKDKHWVLQSCDKKLFYAKTKQYLLHRYITNCPDDKIIDHINHNTLDNRKRNLRICTASENNSNRSPLKNSKSGHVGVCWRENEKAWRVHYMGKEIAYTKSLEEAIKIRKSAEAPKLPSFILRGGFNGKSSF